MKEIIRKKSGPKGISLKKFLKILKEKLGDEYKYISGYQNMTTGKVKIKHIKCGRIYEVQPKNIRGGRGKCECTWKLGRTYTFDEFIEKFNKKYKDRFKYISGYTGMAKDKIKFKCKNCGNIETRYRPNDILRNDGGSYFCPKCETNKIIRYSNLSEKEFIKALKKERNDEYEYISNYKNFSSPCIIKHRECGNIFNGYPNKLITNTIERRNCPHCSKNPKKIELEDFLKRFKDILGDEYTYISGYTGMTNKCKIKHNICGNIFETCPSYMLGQMQTRCPYCITNKRVTEEELIQRIHDLTNGEYEYVSDYITMHHNKIKILHHKCGKIFEMTPHNFSNGQRCPICMDIVRLSKGEVEIAKWLDKHDFIYFKQHRIDDCKYIDSLRFDFMIPSTNKKSKTGIFCLIEFDGKQHYMEGASDFYKLDIIKERDKVKNKYCKKHNIRLLRIPYYNLYDINKILKKYFKNYL